MDPFLAEIVMFGGNFAPRGWALCDGQLLAISQNTALFSLLGTTYGGDGRTTFALPDLRGRAAVHAGTGPGLTNRRLGERSGTEHNILNVTQIPSHSHAASLKVSNADATVSAATQGASIATPGTSDGRSFTGTLGYGAGAPNVDLSAASVTTGNTGGNQSVNNMQPYEVVNYIICMQGAFPSRS